jgi:hypothetical protein
VSARRRRTSASCSSINSRRLLSCSSMSASISAASRDQRRFKARQRLHVQVVRRLVERQQIPVLLQHFGQMHAVALAAGKLPGLLLLAQPFEVEPAAIGAGVRLGKGLQATWCVYYTYRTHEAGE